MRRGGEGRDSGAERGGMVRGEGRDGERRGGVENEGGDILYRESSTNLHMIKYLELMQPS